MFPRKEVEPLTGVQGYAKGGLPCRRQQSAVSITSQLDCQVVKVPVLYPNARESFMGRWPRTLSMVESSNFRITEEPATALQESVLPRSFNGWLMIICLHLYTVIIYNCSYQLYIKINGFYLYKIFSETTELKVMHF